MLEFIKGNVATILVGAVVFALFAAVMVKLIRDKLNHKSSCAGCAGCPSAGMCHTMASPDK